MAAAKLLWRCGKIPARAEARATLLGQRCQYPFH